MSETLPVPALSPDADALACVSAELARRYRCIPIRRTTSGIAIALDRPGDLALIAELEFLTGLRVEAVAAGASEIERALEAAYGVSGPVIAAPGPASAPPRVDPPVVRLADFLIGDASVSRASDLHVDPGPASTHIRYRVDGAIQNRYRLPGWLHPRLIARIKVMAGLDISERRVGQDGRLAVPDLGIEARVSVVPTTCGEAAVVRLFGNRTAPPDLDELGGPGVVTRLRAIANRPQGILVVAGPTGSGKTTTLYAVIEELAGRDVNIVTIEDPVEFRVGGVRQIQVDPGAGMTFANALRSVLRQDPDVILVGEIRDRETARTAFDAALTGHLVLATLHATDAVSAVVRLRELGIPPRTIAAALAGAVSQRLVRVNCRACLRTDVPDRLYLDRLGIEPSDLGSLGRGAGCENCAFTGFDGRTAFFEILEVDGQVRSALFTDDDAALARAARGAGMTSIFDQVVDQVRCGLIAVEEAFRSCYFGEGR